MSSTQLLNEESNAGANVSYSRLTLNNNNSYNNSNSYAGTPKLESQTVSFSILRFDKSKYFKNVRHSDVITEEIYTHPYNCGPRCSKYTYFYCLCIFILFFIAGVIYSGYYVLDLAIIRDHYGHSFNINGTCLCLQSSKTSYAWQQQWKIYNLSICDGIKPKDYTFWSETGQQWVNKGDIKPCYTNSRCSRIFTSLSTNVIIDEAIYLYVGAIMIFLFVTIFCIGSIIYLCYLPHSLGIKILHLGPMDVKDHFEDEWKSQMSAKQRFDYWISYTTRELNIFLGSDSIYELLLTFYDDDQYQHDGKQSVHASQIIAKNGVES